MKDRALLVCVAVFVGACGGRSQIENEFVAQSNDGAIAVDDSAVLGGDTGSVVELDTGVPVEDTSVVVDSTPPPPQQDTGINFFDIFPIPDPESGPIGACATCVAQNCANQVNKCLNDPTCLQGLGCVATTCLASGGLDIGCLTGCFGSDFSTALEAIGAITCVVQTCGSDCGGLGGLIPGGGGGGGGAQVLPLPRSAEELRSLDPRARIPMSREAFAPWSAALSSTTRP